MDIRIQYEGFVDALTSRAYNFLVLDVVRGSRRFTVVVPSESFRANSLKFQDGPSISFEMLKQELDRETQEVPAKAHLNIAATDVQQYMQRHFQRKRS